MFPFVGDIVLNDALGSQKDGLGQNFCTAHRTMNSSEYGPSLFDGLARLNHELSNEH